MSRESPFRYEDFDGTSVVRGAAIDPDDCTIAAWTADALVASWDGGVSFARYEVRPGIATAAVAKRRVVVLRRDNALGVVRAGGTQIVWRDLSMLASATDPHGFSLSAGGDWTLVSRSPDPLLAASSDDGATWKYLTPPPAHTFEVTADGRIWATEYDVVVDGLEPGMHPDAFRWHYYLGDVQTGRWRDSRVPFRKPNASAWTYKFAEDKSWSDGNTRKLIALRHGREVATVLADLDGDDSGPRVVSNGRITYAMLDAGSFRVRGTRAVATKEPIPFPSRHVVGVDNYGTVIAVDEVGLVRWSERGGLRRLWLAPTPPSAR
jgi:hypothetical protein